jgi:hypothetical protein
MSIPSGLNYSKGPFAGRCAAIGKITNSFIGGHLQAFCSCNCRGIKSFVFLALSGRATSTRLAAQILRNDVNATFVPKGVPPGMLFSGNALY